MPDQFGIRIAIADDHEIFRDGLKRLLASEPGFRVVGEAADGLEAVQMVREIRPDVLLLDVSMPRMDGIEALGETGAEDASVILLTAGIDTDSLLRAVRLGARGIVLKESATRQLIDGIRRVVRGEILIPPELSEQLAEASREGEGSRERPFGLTPREMEIVHAVATGDSNRDIAARLNISPQTVKHHLTSIFDKTGVSTRLELALFAIRHGVAGEN
jgi:DNA-binding NarL/FixJ family response regulator